MLDVSCVIFYAGKMLQTIELPQVALNINLFEGPLVAVYLNKNVRFHVYTSSHLRF
jgi:hypothetical protein